MAGFSTPFPTQEGTAPLGRPTSKELLDLANRQNYAVNTLRKAGVDSQAFITAIHVIEAFGGNFALLITRSGCVVREQLVDFITDVENLESNALMVADLTLEQKQAALHINAIKLAAVDIAVLIY
jgi:tryptophan synthase alpha subunit